ncbi:Glycosyltransferase involved in cell wall bisynthesis [Syntrophus gentianae]|uniref:Glycosyltransferase involved in cell wall bisynthesis n=1 Tax=Syntrophus gentianae TaxID=43775 RepID=A0A1H7W8T5_9BACT|nr:glycosyltransferase family 2 protein [Syntrophus gentianae]SEM17913.1 Glycosyltransferase involved in cell wall bisynthesis [Syntrophus gentianae]
MKPFTRPDISIVIPAHNEAASIGDIVKRAGSVMDACKLSHEILVIDDGSEDDTAKNAGYCGARVIRHPYAIGNGAAIKTGIRNTQGDILVMLDGDGQHAPEDIPHLLEKMAAYDMTVGARNRYSDTPLHRDFANAIYNRFASYVCKRKIDDLTSGFRAIKAVVAREFVSLLPNTFSYPTTLTLAVVRSGYSLAYVPIATARRIGKSKIRLFRDGARFFLILLKIATLFSPMRVFLPVSFFMLATGLGYGLFRIFTMDGRYGPTSAMLMTMSVVVFMVGLVSEQVAQLRYERTDQQRSAPQTQETVKEKTHEP